jgi:dTDP-4-amino-4,6-dideoxygalactose transaminase
MSLAPIEFAGCRREHVDLADILAPLVAQVLSGGQMLQGGEVSALEERLAATCQRRHAVCVGSGTDALFFALVAAGIGPGDEVLAPDVSFIASASAIARTGARPVFVDVDEACFIDLERAAEAITPATRAILVVQIFGAMADPSALTAFANAHGLALIEDAAQAFGADFAGAAAGGTGLVSALSFDPMKVLSAPGSGGAVLTNDADVAARVRRLRYHGREGGAYVELGYNSQLPSLSAAVLCAKLGHQRAWAARRAALAAAFIEGLEGLPVAPLPLDERVGHVWHKFVVRLDDRDALASHLKGLGVPTMIHYPRPFHREPLFGVRPDGDFPRASEHAGRTLSLPIHAHLTDAEAARIVQGVRNFFGS